MKNLIQVQIYPFIVISEAHKSSNGQIIERMTGRTYDGSLEKNGIGKSNRSVWPFCRTLLENRLTLAPSYHLFHLFMHVQEREVFV